MIPRLRPGQEATQAFLNELVDAVNAAQITSSDFLLEKTSAGTKLKMARRPEDFYARIIETEGRKKDAGDAVKDGEYEWREIYLPGVVGGEYPPEEFENLPDGEGRASVYDPNNDKVFDPAYELSNDRTVKADTLVRMRVYPGIQDSANERGFIRRYVFTQAAAPTPLLLAEAASDWEENGTYPEGNPRIRCYQLIPDPDTEPTPTEPHPKTMVTGDPIWIELPRERDGGKGSDGAGLGKAHSTDPALYAGDRLYYSVDDQERLICRSPYLHMSKIGKIEMMGMTSTGDPEDEIPVGWHECNGVTLNGNAGDITLANFARNERALGGLMDKYGAMPRHASSDHEVNEDRYAEVFDGIGEAGGQFQLPNGNGSALTTPWAGHTHNIEVQQGEYPVCIVFFYGRFK
jgi:hypothetical protein